MPLIFSVSLRFKKRVPIREASGSAARSLGPVSEFVVLIAADNEVEKANFLTPDFFDGFLLSLVLSITAISEVTVRRRQVTSSRWMRIG
jgi:hypothetical protein